MARYFRLELTDSAGSVLDTKEYAVKGRDVRTLYGIDLQVPEFWGMVPRKPDYPVDSEGHPLQKKSARKKGGAQ